MKEPTHHWQWGRISGYHWCCIAWFYVRLGLYVKTGLLNVMWKLFPSMPRKFNDTPWQHVLCPGHILAAKLGKFEAKYTHCDTCGNMRYGDPVECPLAEDHDGWVRGRFGDYYENVSYQRQKGTKIVIVKHRGRIPKEERKKKGLE